VTSAGAQTIGSERVLLEGGLHPVTFLLRLGRLGRFLFILALPVLFRGADAAPLDFLGPALAFVALGTLGPLLELVSFRYRLTDRELSIRVGVFARTERRIPVDRIHDLGLEQTFLRRLLGVVTVTVETSGSGGAEVTLDAVSRDTADALRAQLEEAGAGAGPRGRLHPRDATDADDGSPSHPSPGAPARSGTAQGLRPRRPEAPEIPIHRASSGSLAVRGLTDNRAGLLFVAVISLAELASIAVGQPLEFLLADRWLRSAQLLARAPLESWILLGAVFALVALVVGWVIAGVLSWIGFFGFELAYREGLFVRRYGLLTSRVLSVPAHRVQLVRLVQSPLRRLVGVGTLEVESAGSGRGEGEGQAGQVAEGTETFVPLARRRRLLAVARDVLAGSRRWGGDGHRLQSPSETVVPSPDDPKDAVPAQAWRRTSLRIVPRYGLRGFLLGLGATAGLRAVLGATPESAADLLVPASVLAVVALFAGVARYRALAYAIDKDTLVLRDGVLGRVVTYIPLGRLQAAAVVQRPIERVQRVARLEVAVLGGAGAALPNIPVDAARRLLPRLFAG
jgi:putative membrane protein